MRYVSFLLVVMCFVSCCFAQDVVNKPLISNPQKLVFKDSFDRSMIGPNWKADPAMHRIINGALVCKSTKEKRSSATSAFATPCRNLGVTFRVRCGDAQTFGFAISGKPAGFSGAVIGVWFSENRVQINAEAASLDDAKIEISRNEWHEVMLEMVGQNAVLQVDGKKVLEVQDASFLKYPKKGILLVTDEGAAEFDNVMAGEVGAK